MKMSTVRWAWVPVAVMLLGMNGCGTNDSNPTSSGVAIGETFLYPFSPGRLIVYSEYTLDTLGAQVVSSVHRRVTFVNATVTRNGKSAYELIDSIYAPGGAFLSTEVTYAAVENGDLLLEFDGAWSTVFKRSSGTNVSYYVRTYNDTSAGFPIPVTVNGKITATEALTTPGGVLQAYKLELAGTVNVGLTTITIPVYTWFADNYGPVKQTEPPMRNPLTGKMGTGTEMIFVSKNF